MLKYKVKTLRDQLGMSIRALSAVSGVSHATINRIERGKVEAVRPETLKGLAVPLGVTVDYLLDRTDEPGSPHDDETSDLFEINRRLTPERREQLLEYGHFLVGIENAAPRVEVTVPKPDPSKWFK